LRDKFVLGCLENATRDEFVSRWSVLEFSFCLIESTKKTKTEAGDEIVLPESIGQFGEGVLLSADEGKWGLLARQ
jgi:hypothetical protein